MYSNKFNLLNQKKH